MEFKLLTLALSQATLSSRFSGAISLGWAEADLEAVEEELRSTADGLPIAGGHQDAHLDQRIYTPALSSITQID